MNVLHSLPRGVEAVEDHDAAPGPLSRCQITGSQELYQVLDLGHQPPCDALLTPEQLRHPEVTYPLRLMHCPESGLAQLDYVVPGDVIYPADYPYRAGISWPLREYLKSIADELVERRGIAPRSLVVDIGCNDGTLLAAFQARGCRVLGVEPTGMGRFAKEAGIGWVQAFFCEALARDIVRTEGRAQLVTMTNVFAHMANLGEVMRGLEALLARDGIFVTETHYLLDVLEKTQFDTIYHEHIRTYSLKSLALLFAQYGMEVFDVERGSRYGGNLRAYVARQGVRPVERRVGELLRHEDQAGLHRSETWIAFRQRVLHNRDLFMDWLLGAHRKGYRIAGCSAPGRAATLINFYGIGPDLVPYLGEIPGSQKIGKYFPGRRIPIVPGARIAKEQPDYVILFAWHYAAEIAARLRREGVTSKLVQALPSFRELDA